MQKAISVDQPIQRLDREKLTENKDSVKRLLEKAKLEISEFLNSCRESAEICQRKQISAVFK